MVKSYLQYGLRDVFGCVTSPTVPGVASSDGRFFFSAAEAAVNVWSNATARFEGRLLPGIKRLEELQHLKAVTSLAVTAGSHHQSTQSANASAQVGSKKGSSDGGVIVGYGDGHIKIFKGAAHPASSEVTVTFSGHKQGVSALCVSHDDKLLASGGRDHEIVLWDIVANEGRCRFPTGHTQPITSLHFIYPSLGVVGPLQSFTGESAGASAEDDQAGRKGGEAETGGTKKRKQRDIQSAHQTSVTLQRFGTSPTHLLSTSLDGLIKIWDLTLQTCVATHVSQSAHAIHTALLSPDQRHLLLGLAGRNLELFTRDSCGKLEQRVGEGRDGDGGDGDGAKGFEDDRPTYTFKGYIPRPEGSRGCVQQMAYLGLPGAKDKSAETLRREALVRDALMSTEFALGGTGGASSVGWHWRADGSLIAGDLSEVVTIETEAVILVAANDRHMDVLIRLAGAGAKRRELRLLKRRLEKLRKLKNKASLDRETDKELEALLGDDWDTEDGKDDAIKSENTRLDVHIAALKNAIAARQPTLNSTSKIDPEKGENKLKKCQDIAGKNSDGTEIVEEEIVEEIVEYRMCVERLTLSDAAATGDRATGVVCTRAGEVIVNSSRNVLLRLALDFGELLNVRATKKDFARDDLTLFARCVLAETRLGALRNFSANVTDMVFSHDNRQLLTISQKGGVDVWDVMSLSVVSRFESLTAPNCGFFLPGDEYAVIGTAKGSLAIVGLEEHAVMTEISDSDAHFGAVARLACSPSCTQLASIGQQDRFLKLWNLSFSESSGFSLSPSLVAELAATPTAVAFSPNGQWVAVALANNTAAVYFADTLKLLTTLHAHSLPLTSVAFSSDSQLVCSGSQDRFVKVWETDHWTVARSLGFTSGGHVTDVAFAPDTHYVVAAYTNGFLSFFDVDTGERIASLKAGAVSSLARLALTADAEVVAAATSERSVSLWQRTTDQLFLSEEREREEDAENETRAARGDLHLPGAKAGAAVVEMRASRKDIASVRSIEQFLQALDDAKTEAEAQADAGVPAKNRAGKGISMLFGRSPAEHVVHALNLIPTELQTEVLLGLPSAALIPTLTYAMTYLDKICSTMGSGERPAGLNVLAHSETAACVKAVLTLCHSHHHFLRHATEHTPLLLQLNTLVKRALDEMLDSACKLQVAFSFLNEASAATKLAI